MAYPILVKQKAISFRERGYSLKEIHEITGVSKSILSEWLRGIFLNDSAKSRLLTRIKLGQINSAESKKAKTNALLKNYFEQATRNLNDLKMNKNLYKVICSLVYWCEGAKNHYYGMQFTNSDPNLVKFFLTSLRRGFKIDEKRFRICVHLHEYHNPAEQIMFWSKVTNIPIEQFIKPYIKPHTGLRIRENYPGCVSIKYWDTATARELLMTARATFKKI